ncbi:winged helix-turn-helix domain-containing protein [Streptomyces bobili]|uniref:winged helix-turn-helix domain-containing protein n=1 Tax=Streptomyces bobili TaxID=67280 RepID=UPI003813D119
MLEQELAHGSAVHGWSDQTWTLTRIKMLIGHRFYKSMTLSVIAQMLHGHGFSHQSRPALCWSVARMPSPAG